MSRAETKAPAIINTSKAQDPNGKKSNENPSQSSLIVMSIFFY